MKPYTVILICYKHNQTRVYEVYAMNAQTAFGAAIIQDSENYPEHLWAGFVDHNKGSFEIMRGHNLTEMRG